MGYGAALRYILNSNTTGILDMQSQLDFFSLLVRCIRETDLMRLDRALLQNLLDHILLFVGTKLIFQCSFGGSIQFSLIAMPVASCQCPVLLLLLLHTAANLLVGHKDLEGIDDLHQWYRLVLLPAVFHLVFQRKR